MGSGESKPSVMNLRIENKLSFPINVSVYDTVIRKELDKKVVKKTSSVTFDLVKNRHYITETVRFLLTCDAGDKGISASTHFYMNWKFSTKRSLLWSRYLLKTLHYRPQWVPPSYQTDSRFEREPDRTFVVTISDTAETRQFVNNKQLRKDNEKDIDDELYEQAVNRTLGNIYNPDYDTQYCVEELNRVMNKWATHITDETLDFGINREFGLSLQTLERGVRDFRNIIDNNAYANRYHTDFIEAIKTQKKFEETVKGMKLLNEHKKNMEINMKIEQQIFQYQDDNVQDFQKNVEKLEKSYQRNYSLLQRAETIFRENLKTDKSFFQSHLNIVADMLSSTKNMMQELKDFATEMPDREYKLGCLRRDEGLELEKENDFEQALLKFKEAKRRFDRANHLHSTELYQEQMKLAQLKSEGMELLVEGEKMEQKAFVLFRASYNINDENGLKQCRKQYEDVMEMYQKAEKIFAEGAEIDKTLFGNNVDLAKEMQIELAKVVTNVGKVTEMVRDKVRLEDLGEETQKLNLDILEYI